MAKNIQGLEDLELEKDETPYVLELTDIVEVGPGYEIPKEEKSVEEEIEPVTQLKDIEPLAEEELSLEQEEIKVSEAPTDGETLEPQVAQEIITPIPTAEVSKEVKEPFLTEDVLAAPVTETSLGVQPSIDMERLESLITEVVNRAVEKATKEAMLQVAEKVIGEAIEKLKESMLKDF